MELQTPMIAVSWGKPEPRSSVWINPQWHPMKQALIRLCHERNVSYQEVLGCRRSRSIAWPRQEMMVEIKNAFPAASLLQIAKIFNRDHTTLLHAVREVERRKLERMASVKGTP